MIRRMLAGAFALALAGCGSWNPWAGPQEERVAPPADAVTFQCDGGRRLTVRMPASAKSVMVMLPERQFRLDESPAASGVRYSNGRTTFHVKGDEAFLEEDGKMLFGGCKRVR
jgi:membrane-bound inhibitor of C-type lysozyme